MKSPNYGACRTQFFLLPFYEHTIHYRCPKTISIPNIFHDISYQTSSTLNLHTLVPMKHQRSTPKRHQPQTSTTIARRTPRKTSHAHEYAAKSLHIVSLQRLFNPILWKFLCHLSHRTPPQRGCSAYLHPKRIPTCIGRSNNSMLTHFKVQIEKTTRYALVCGILQLAAKTCYKLLNSARSENRQASTRANKTSIKLTEFSRSLTRW